MPTPVKFDKIDPKFESREWIVSERKPGFHYSFSQNKSDISEIFIHVQM